MKCESRETDAVIRVWCQELDSTPPIQVLCVPLSHLTMAFWLAMFLFSLERQTAQQNLKVLWILRWPHQSHPHHWPHGPLLLWDTVDHSLLQTRRESYLVYHPCSGIFQSQITHHGFTFLRWDMSIHTGRMPAPSVSNHSWEQQASGAGINMRTH